MKGRRTRGRQTGGFSSPQPTDSMLKKRMPSLVLWRQTQTRSGVVVLLVSWLPILSAVLLLLLTLAVGVNSFGTPRHHHGSHGASFVVVGNSKSLRKSWQQSSIFCCSFFLHRLNNYYPHVDSNNYWKRRHSPAAVSSGLQRHAFEPSRVVDPDGPTPPPPDSSPPLVDPKDIPGMHYDPNAHPIPHQPWRRGDTDGCEAPISAPWRQEAEHIIKGAVALVGGTVLDITWYMAKCVITLHHDFSNVQDYEKGPIIQVEYPPDINEPQYIDPTANDEDLWDEDVDPSELTSSSTSSIDNDHDDDDGHDTGYDYSAYTGGANDEDDIEEEEDDVNKYEDERSFIPQRRDHVYSRATRTEKITPKTPEEQQQEQEGRYYESRDERIRNWTEEDEIRYNSLPRDEIPPKYQRSLLGGHGVDTMALSTIANAILTALGDDEIDERLNILERHEIILTSPLGDAEIIETQSQFDDNRDGDVWVETRDPFQSNRMLKGKLVDRNALDVVLNIRGRMVTIPMNFVHKVRVPPYRLQNSNELVDAEEEADEEYEEGEEYDDDDDEYEEEEYEDEEEDEDYVEEEEYEEEDAD